MGGGRSTLCTGHRAGRAWPWGQLAAGTQPSALWVGRQGGKLAGHGGCTVVSPPMPALSESGLPEALRVMGRETANTALTGALSRPAGFKASVSGVWRLCC